MYALTTGRGREREAGKIERGKVSAKLNLQHLISLFELHLSHGAAASNHDLVNIQMVAFYYLICIIQLIYLEILCTHFGGHIGGYRGRIEDERLMSGRKTRDNVEQKETVWLHNKGPLWISVSIRCRRACKYMGLLPTALNN